MYYVRGHRNPADLIGYTYDAQTRGEALQIMCNILRTMKHEFVQVHMGKGRGNILYVASVMENEEVLLERMPY